MPEKKWGFSMGYDTRFDRPVFFGRGDAKLLSWKATMGWQFNRGDASYLMLELHDLLKQTHVVREMLELVDEEHIVPAALNEGEKFNRRVYGLPETSYSFTSTYLRFVPALGFEYRINLNRRKELGDTAGAVRELLEKDIIVTSKEDFFELAVPNAPKGYSSGSICFFKVVHSPLLVELQAEPTAD